MGKQSSAQDPHVRQNSRAHNQHQGITPTVFALQKPSQHYPGGLEGGAVVRGLAPRPASKHASSSRVTTRGRKLKDKESN